MRSFHLLLYLVNSSLLITHEIDSGYWREWDLFGIGGDIEIFLIINFILVVVMLFGYRILLEGVRSGYLFSFAVAVSGISAFSIHGYFLMTGHGEFTTTVSMIILALTGLLSAVQGPTAFLLYRAQLKSV
jgi:hypothetical protein